MVDVVGDVLEVEITEDCEEGKQLGWKLGSKDNNIDGTRLEGLTVRDTEG